MVIRVFQEACSINNRTDLSDLAKEIILVGLINGMSEEKVRALSIESYRELPKTFDSTPPDKLISEFEIDGKTYKVDTIFRYAGQFIDYSKLSEDPINNLHLILALFAYEGDYMENIQERAEIFRDKCDYRVAQSVAFFFSRLIRELSLSVEIFSKGRGADGTKTNGDGVPRSIHSLMETALNGTRFSRWAARNFLTTSQ